MLPLACLLTIKLNNQLLVDRAVNIFTRRQRCRAARHLAARRNPRRPSATSRRLPGTFNVHVLTAAFFDRNHVTGLHLIRRNINLLFIHQHVPVIDELPRLASRSRKAGAIHGIVQTALEQEQKVLARDALLTRGALKVVSKLSFEDKVDALDLLLFAQLLAVPCQSFATTHRVAMLSRRLGPAFLDRTRRLVTAISLEEKFCTFAAAQAAHRISIPSQSFLPPVSITDGKVYRPRLEP